MSSTRAIKKNDDQLERMSAHTWDVVESGSDQIYRLDKSLKGSWSTNSQNLICLFAKDEGGKNLIKHGTSSFEIAADRSTFIEYNLENSCLFSTKIQLGEMDLVEFGYLGSIKKAINKIEDELDFPMVSQKCRVYDTNAIITFE